MRQMWGTKTLDRARRRLAGGDRAERPAGLVATATALPLDVELRLTRRELDLFAMRLDAALASHPGAERPRLDTPARLASALGRAIETTGGMGRVVVNRDPGGLYTPESWRIHVSDTDEAARAEIARLAGSSGAE